MINQLIESLSRLEEEFHTIRATLQDQGIKLPQERDDNTWEVGNGWEESEW